MPATSFHESLPALSAQTKLYGGATEGLFSAASLAAGYYHTTAGSCMVRKLSLDDLCATGGELVASTIQRSDRVFEALLRRDDAYLFVETHPGHMTVRVASNDRHTAKSNVDEIIERFRDEWTPHQGTVVNITVWINGPQGPMPMPVRIEAPTWEEIADNYPAQVRDGLHRMMESRSGQVEGIALWRGEPGTGKTTALRTLAWEWRDWCDVHVILDPEVFLGDQASYMVNMLMMTERPSMAVHMMQSGMPPHVMMEMMAEGAFDEDDEISFSTISVGGEGYGGYSRGVSFSGAPDGGEVDDGDMDYVTRSRMRAGMTRARLIVLEDAGELVKADARIAAGQALSRLLNLSDGIIGQGTNASVLVTTNEELGALHPAVARPGRCWAHVEFEPFNESNAADWLTRNKVEHNVSGTTTLAELYGWKRGDGIVQIGNLRDDVGGHDVVIS